MTGPPRRVSDPTPLRRKIAHSADWIIWALADRQHGVVARSQLIAAGIGDRQIARRLADRRLTQIHAGVYQVGPILIDLGRLQAALFACGPDAVLSHWSGAYLWECGEFPDPIWVTVPRTQSARRPGLRIVRADLDPRDVRRHRGLAVTSPPRAILDCAALTGDSRLERMVAEAGYRGYARDGEIYDQIQRNHGKRGNARTRRVIDLDGGPQRSRSSGERELLRLLRASGLRGFEMNARIHGFEVDFFWRDADFVVELDGFDGHRGRSAFERDRLKWATLQSRGIKLMPITGRQVLRDPAGVVSRIRATLARNVR